MATHLLSTHLQHLTHQLGLSQDDLALAVGTDRKTIARWQTARTHPQSASRARLDALDALAARLNETFIDPIAARDWLVSESGYFGGLAPRDALLRGRIDAVNAALDALDAGVFV